MANGHPKDRSLGAICTFQGLPAELIADLDLRCLWQTFPPDTFVIDYRDASTDVFFVVRGHLRASIMSVAGKIIAFRELGPGGMFGELSAVDGKPRSASVETLETCLIAQMRADEFNGLIEREPLVMKAVMRHMAGLIRSLSERYYELSAFGVCSRLHAEILRLALAGTISGRRAIISPLPTHAELASRIGSNREAVTRELNRLEREKVIVRSHAGAIVDLPRMDALVRAARGEFETQPPRNADRRLA